jgi:DNA primase
MPDFYQTLKQRTDIVSEALALGYKGSKSGSCYQGDCPRHGSASGQCLVIWPVIQGYRCYHCGQSGDVINLVQLYKNCDHKTAVDYLAEKVGMTPLASQSLSTEELSKLQADLGERNLVEGMLSEAAGWYHGQLKNFPQIEAHLLNHYGFSTDIIEELQIGFAPPGTSAPSITSDLALHLESMPRFKGKLALSGLFSFQNPNGPFWDFFKGRIVFPYWKNGKVVNMIARATVLTPVDQYECYADKDGNIKKDVNGNPEFIKYKRLRTHDPNHAARKYISPFIEKDSLMGEDSIRGAKEIIITEGAPDWVSAVDKEFAAISPVTTSFKEEDVEKLGILTAHANEIYIVNDNEDNKAGYEGALRTAKRLSKSGKNVFIVELPRPAGVSKVDLNEYFLNHTTDDLRKLMGESKTYLDILIDAMPADYVRAQPKIKEDFAPAIINFDEGLQEYYIEKLRKKVKTSQKAIRAEIEAARKNQSAKLTGSIIDSETEKAAMQLALDPGLLKKRIDVVNAGGVVGERNVIAMYFCVLDSRLLPDNNKSPNVLALKNAGHFGSGKSYTLMSVLEIYPEGNFHLITNGSPKSIYHLEVGLKNKALVIMEGFQFQEKNAADSELVYVIRSLISEGRVSYQFVEKDDNGKLKTVVRTIEGPTSFITTTVMEKLEPQFEDRLFTIHPDESVQQTKDIIAMRAEMMSGHISGLDKKTIELWKAFHSILQPVEVIIPFAPDIARFINENPGVPIAARRAFNRVIAVTQTIACTYQHQRKKDAKGRIVAEIADYDMALQIVSEAFRESVGQESRDTQKRIAFIEEKRIVSYTDLSQEWGISKSAVSQWAYHRVREGILAWCDESGGEFANIDELKKAKSSGRALLRISDSYTPSKSIGLPTPFDLTKDAAWKTDGALWNKYDLALEAREGIKAYSGIKEVLSEGLNTSQDSEPIDIGGNSGNKDEGIKVLSQDMGMDEENLETDESIAGKKKPKPFFDFSEGVLAI